MNTNNKRTISHAANKLSFNLAIMIITLLCGILIACFTASYFEDRILDVFSDCVDISKNGVSEYSFSKALGSSFKYPLLAILFSTTSLGVIFIPVLVFSKAFLLCLSISSVIKAVAQNGIIVALSIFGIQSFFGLPCLLIISAVCFEQALAVSGFFTQKHKTPQIRPVSKSSILLLIICFSSLFICSILDFAITPSLVNAAING